MKARIAALIAAAGAAAAAAGAAAWAKRQADEDEALEAEIFAAVEAEALAEAEAAAAEEPTHAPESRVATIPVEPDADAELAAAAPLTTEVDDLTALKGIGAVSAERLSGIGITSFTQLAAWSDADIDEIGPSIKVSPDRIRRENWVGQARALAGAVEG